jgi:hypothetical protein
MDDLSARYLNNAEDDRGVPHFDVTIWTGISPQRRKKTGTGPETSQGILDP